MKCVFINEVKFSKESLYAIKDIRRKSQMISALSKLMPAGIMINIFLGNGVLKSTYNISQTDFKSLANAVSSLPAIERRVIYTIAADQALFHKGKESMFWGGIADGCSIK